MISWYYIYYDGFFALEFMNNIFSYKDYFVALVEPGNIERFKAYRNYNALSDERGKPDNDRELERR